MKVMQFSSFDRDGDGVSCGLNPFGIPPLKHCCTASCPFFLLLKKKKNILILEEKMALGFTWL
jgi:hypothetical protein